MINIFGSPTLQKNILHSIYISNEVKEKAEFYTGYKKGSILYIPSSPPYEASIEKAKELRENFNIKESDFVFGRIGRNSDSIFDPIGIKAFQELSKVRNDIHFIIMSPPPILEKIVRDEKIKNVHFISPSSDELDIWGFHFAIDCLAHFRMDGESCGLNIAESMYVGNPIITHRSHIWNAHIEYLKNTFSRVADKDDYLSYATYMKEFVEIKNTQPDIWNKMRRSSYEAAIQNFSISEYKKSFKEILSTL
jgi:glycosyltransferase involved in cell wall biosynthesis